MGVGVLISLGFLKILFNIKFKYMFTSIYFIILVIFVFVTEEFQAIAFDASGATTGAMTTPFIMAMGLGISRLKGSNAGEEDSFGLVGMASAGPILAIKIMSLLLKVDNIQGTTEVFELSSGIINPFIHSLRGTLFESLLALAPITILFISMNHYIYIEQVRDIFIE